MFVKFWKTEIFEREIIVIFFSFFFYVSMIFRFYDFFIAIFCISLISYTFISKFKEKEIPEYGYCLPFKTIQFFSNFDFQFENQSINIKKYSSEYELLESSFLYDSIKIIFQKSTNNSCFFNETSLTYNCFIDIKTIETNKYIKYNDLSSLLIKTVSNPLQISDDLDGVEQCAAVEEMAEILNCNRTTNYSNHFDIYNSIRGVYTSYFKPKLFLDIEEKAAILIPTLLPSIIIIFRIFIKGK